MGCGAGASGMPAPTNIDGLPTWTVGRDRCVPPLAGTFHFPRADGFHPVGRGLAPAAGGGYPARCWLMVHAVHPVGAAARTMALGRGLRHLRMALWDAGGFRPLRRAGASRRARRGYFARCGGRPKAEPLETAIWATRRRLARGVGEEFCGRARRSFAAILDVWQEAGPRL